MKKATLAILVSLGAVSGLAHAQMSDSSRPAPNTVVEITDPARIADIEQRARAIQSQGGYQNYRNNQTAQGRMMPTSDDRAMPRHHRRGMKHHRMHRSSTPMTPPNGDQKQ